MIKLVIVRHGQSLWNLENRFTGWTDIDLSAKGIEEAKEAGQLLKNKNYTFDICYTSLLRRAIDTAIYILEEMQLEIPVKYSYHLNERHYGALQGLNKDETKKKYGDEQVNLWRRSVDVRPPALTIDDPRYPGFDIKYKDLSPKELPLTENLNDTINRVVDYYESDIKKDLLHNKKVLIVAHGNSIRGLVKYFEHLSDEAIMQVEIPTGKPFVYELDDNLEVLNKYYL